MSVANISPEALLAAAGGDAGGVAVGLGVVTGCGAGVCRLAGELPWEPHAAASTATLTIQLIRCMAASTLGVGERDFSDVGDLPGVTTYITEAETGQRVCDVPQNRIPRPGCTWRRQRKHD